MEDPLVGKSLYKACETRYDKTAKNLKSHEVLSGEDAALLQMLVRPNIM